MIEAEEIAKQVLEQGCPDAGDALEATIDENLSIRLETSALDGYQILSLIASDTSITDRCEALERMLRKSFDERLGSNMVAAVSPDDECLLTIPFFNGFQTTGLVEAGLNLLSSTLEYVAETESSLTDEVAPQADWMQV